jgi:hypothetical protein
MDAYEPNERNIGYCKGFVDGYEQGISNNPYDGGNPNDAYNHLQYKLGYDAGVAEYCKDNIDIEEYVTYTSIDE